MKSNKQRRAELQELRAKQEAKRQAKAIAHQEQANREKMPANAVTCHPEQIGRAHV